MVKTSWLIEFKRETKKLVNKSKGFWYQHNQNSLKTLLRTGIGSCIAWSLLAMDIAKKINLTIYLIVLRKPGNRWVRHQISLVIESNGNVYLQSGIFATKLRIKLSDSADKKQLIYTLTKCARKCSKRYKRAQIDWLVKFKHGQKTTILDCKINSSWKKYCSKS